MAQNSFLAVALFSAALLSAGNPSESSTPTDRVPSPQSADAKFYSYVNGEKWEFIVADTDLVNVPVWAATDDAPPLPPRAAIRSAGEMLRKLLADGGEWEFESVTLRPQRTRKGPDTWLYLVTFLSPFQPRSGVAGSVIRSPVTLLVLMNGRAVAPARSPHSQ